MILYFHDHRLFHCLLLTANFTFVIIIFTPTAFNLPCNTREEKVPRWLLEWMFTTSFYTTSVLTSAFSPSIGFFPFDRVFLRHDHFCLDTIFR